MARKTKSVQQETEKVRREAEKAVQRVKEAEELLKLAEEEDQKRKESVKNSIDIACQSGDLFCGVILTPEDIPSIIRLMIESRENVKIGYNLYFKE